MSKRDYKTGGLRERAPGAFELKVRALDQKTGRRIVKYYSFKGTRMGAKKRLGELLNLANDGALPDEQKLFGVLLDVWISGLDVSPKTSERYKEIAERQIRPHLGKLKVRAITPSRVEQLYGDLRAGIGPDGKEGGRPLSSKTIGHVHRLLVQVFALAERDRVIQSNPARHARRPKEAGGEVEILKEAEVRAVLDKLSGRPLWLIAAVGLATGMRRGELLALRWADIDFEANRIRVVQSLEETRGGLRFKSPKTKQGRRQLTVPASIVTELRAHRRRQLEERLALGLGRDQDDGLVFRQPDGSPLRPNRLSCEWRRAVVALKLPKVSLHSWRHSHASALIAAGVDVVTVSKRLGHASPTITLGVYSHLFHPTDSDAAAVFDRAFSGSFPANKNETGGTK